MPGGDAGGLLPKGEEVAPINPKIKEKREKRGKEPGRSGMGRETAARQGGDERKELQERGAEPGECGAGHGLNTGTDTGWTQGWTQCWTLGWTQHWTLG